MTPTLPRRSIAVALISLSLSAALVRQASAWNDTGHMLTTLVAWEQMDERSRTWAVGLLEQHPRFAEDFARRMPPGLDDADRARWIFARAATWPDVARGFDGEDERRYHHPTWHYAFGFHPLDDAADSAPTSPRNAPRNGGAPRDDGNRGARSDRDRRGGRTARDAASRPATRRAARLTTQPAPRPGDVHIVEALEDSLRRIRDDGLPAAERAVSLCWVLHLIGDIHQPCHAGSLVSERFPPPEGDRGANLVLVEGQSRATNLHSVWDGMAGDNRALSVLSMRTARLLVDPAHARGVLPELQAHPALADWLAESAALSRDAVYDFSVRSALRLQELDPQAPFIPLRLSRNYTADAQMIAHRRITLAGHRIADALVSGPTTRPIRPPAAAERGE